MLTVSISAGNNPAIDDVETRLLSQVGVREFTYPAIANLAKTKLWGGNSRIWASYVYACIYPEVGTEFSGILRSSDHLDNISKKTRKLETTRLLPTNRP